MKRSISIYILSLAAAIGIYCLIVWIGQSGFLTATSSAVANIKAPSAPSDLLAHLLATLLTILIAAKLFGWAFRFFGQPPVIGEVIAGICLGPSLLGRFFPDVALMLLPPQIAPILSMIAQVGVVMFMFIVGVELDARLLRKEGNASTAIAHASIVVPFVLGAILALALYPRFAYAHTSFVLFSLFTGLSLSVTAFPVLARILNDLKIMDSPMAALTLSSAAIGDATAWCLLALVIGIAEGNPWLALQTLLLTVCFAVFMFTVMPLFLRRFVKYTELHGVTDISMVIVIAMVLAAALTTELIGIHALFGPFVLGALIPKSSKLATEVTRRIEHLTLILLLPAFFAFTGMRTQINLMNSSEHWLWCIAIISVASLGKIGGAFVAARWSGIARRDALGIGVLMNTRGLMEIIVLNIGLDLGILSPLLFTIFVIMAVTTTLMTGPLFRLVTSKKPWLAPQPSVAPT